MNNMCIINKINLKKCDYSRTIPPYILHINDQGFFTH